MANENLLRLIAFAIGGIIGAALHIYPPTRHLIGLQYRHLADELDPLPAAPVAIQGVPTTTTGNVTAPLQKAHHFARKCNRSEKVTLGEGVMPSTLGFDSGNCDVITLPSGRAGWVCYPLGCTVVGAP